MDKIKVLHIITHLGRPNGAAEVVLNICRLCDPRKVESSVLYGSLGSNHATLEETARGVGVALHRLPSLRHPVHPVSDPQAYRHLVAFLRRGQYDVVHTHSSKAGVIGRFAAAAADVPAIFHTVHGWGHHDFQHPLVRRFYIEAEKRAARVTDRLIVVSDATGQRGLQDGIGQPEQYETIVPGIDIAKFRDVSADPAALRAKIGIPADALVVGTIGRLAKQKAPGDFVRMAACIHQRYPQTHFVYIGNGPLQAKFDRAVQEAGLASVMHHLGDRKDVPHLQRMFDVFTLTSRWEGMPLVFAQAMCAGLPIVATNVGGAAEAIKEGKNGFLVEPACPEQQAERVMQLLADASLRRKMGACGLAAVSPRFSDAEMARHLEQSYAAYAHVKAVAAPAAPLPYSHETSVAPKPIIS